MQSLLLKQTYIVAKNPYNHIVEKGALFFSYTRVIQGVHPDDTREIKLYALGQLTRPPLLSVNRVRQSIANARFK